MNQLLTFIGLCLLARSYAQNYTCPEGQVLCEGTEGECIPEAYVCDGTFIDCSNDWDELNCPCGFGEFQCPNTTICIPKSYICDFDRDCPGGEDEDQDCPPCPGFSCDNGLCVPQSWVCDGYRDCEGGEDEEQDCPDCIGFECSDGYCIPNAWRCDGYPDCSNDEEDCDCKGFECLDDGTCIPGSWHCDGIVDCWDGSDEENCPRSAAFLKPHPLMRSHAMSGQRRLKSSALSSLNKILKRKTKKSRKLMREERRQLCCSHSHSRKFSN